MISGVVAELWRWPVKSMAGEPVAAARLDERGVAGDRAHVVVHEHKGVVKPLTAREAPRLLAWCASYPFTLDGGLRPGDPPYATVTAPDGRAFAWGDPRLVHALGADLGREVGLDRDPAGVPDLPGSVLVTLEPTRAALSEELGAPIDLRRFRTNLHLACDAEPWAELGWEGGRLRLPGGVELELLHPCERCAIPTRDPDTQAKWAELLRHLAAHHDQRFGINARVVVPGRVERGAEAEVRGLERSAPG
jgi:uncharacterized protein YcbX